MSIFFSLCTIDSPINHHLSHPHLIVASGYTPGAFKFFDITSTLIRNIVICSIQPSGWGQGGRVPSDFEFGVGLSPAVWRERVLAQVWVCIAVQTAV
jgi:hypothetical protein